MNVHAQQPPQPQQHVNAVLQEQPAPAQPTLQVPPTAQAEFAQDTDTLQYEAYCREVASTLHTVWVALAKTEMRRRRLHMETPPISGALLEVLATHSTTGVPHSILREVFGSGKRLDEALKKLQDTGRIREEGERKNRVIHLIA